LACSHPSSPQNTCRCQLTPTKMARNTPPRPSLRQESANHPLANPSPPHCLLNAARPNGLTRSSKPVINSAPPAFHVEHQRRNLQPPSPKRHHLTRRRPARRPSLRPARCRPPDRKAHRMPCACRLTPSRYAIAGGPAPQQKRNALAPAISPKAVIGLYDAPSSPTAALHYRPAGPSRKNVYSTPPVAYAPAPHAHACPARPCTRQRQPMSPLYNISIASRPPYRHGPSPLCSTTSTWIRPAR